MSDYSHEVFVSYCRQQRWTLFVRDQFVPRLCQHLHGEIAREDVFFDETSIGVGAAWEEDIREALEGNYCRCTGYENIVKAVQQAAGQTS